MGRNLALLVALVLAPLALAQSDSARYIDLIAQGDSAVRAREHLKAADAYRKATQIAPWDGALFAKLARAEGRLGNLEGAVAAYKDAIRLGSVMAKHTANHEYQIALLYAKAENEDECFKWLKRSLGHGLRSLGLAQSRRFRLLHDREDYRTLVGMIDTDGMTREQGMAADLRRMDSEVRRVHFAPYAVTLKGELDRAAAQLERDIPNLTDEQFYVRMRQYMRLFGDGHTNVRLGNWKDLTDGAKNLPLVFYWFTDGIHVHAALPGFEEYIGYKVLGMEGVPIDEVVEKITTIVNQDNPQGARNAVPALMGGNIVLKGLGILRGEDVDIQLQAPGNGAVSTVTFQFQEAQTGDYKYVFSGQDDRVPLYFQHFRDKLYWYHVIPEQSALYLQYNSVREDPKKPMQEFMAEVMAKIEELDIQKLIIDVRFNGGGNSFLNASILQPVMRSEKINKNGHLFVITGRQTFSAAQNFASDLMRDSEAIFVGEPTGGAPQFVGETNRSFLPYTKMRISISDLFWQRGWPMDHRIWIPPDLPAPLSVKDYLDNRDPALQAALDYQVKG
ncbi:MAG: hypothetical protein IH945_08815 [Armatimonadetes bacterium]|nr:hypothetical protein [Armatimonadota bacterium]